MESVKRKGLSRLIGAIAGTVRDVIRGSAGEMTPGLEAAPLKLFKSLKEALDSVEECDVEGAKRSVLNAWELVTYAGVLAGRTDDDRLLQKELEALNMMKKFTYEVIGELTRKCRPFSSEAVGELVEKCRLKGNVREW